MEWNGMCTVGKLGSVALQRCITQFLAQTLTDDGTQFLALQRCITQFLAQSHACEINLGSPTVYHSVSGMTTGESPNPRLVKVAHIVDIYRHQSGT